MSYNNKKFGNLTRLKEEEINTIAGMFRLFDRNSTGYIPDYLAWNLMRKIGLDVRKAHFEKNRVSYNELILVIDKIMPEPDPPIASSLISFNNMTAVGTENGNVLRPREIIEFLKSVGENTVDPGEIEILLNSMLPYDDCSEEAEIPSSVFNEYLTVFAKKYNAFKNYKRPTL